MMKTLGYYNGKIGEADRMSVPMLDRACYFGDGVYDVTYSRNRQLMDAEEHIDRLYDGAKRLRIDPELSKTDLLILLKELIRLPESGNLWVYLQFSRGSGQRNHAWDPDWKANLWIMMRPASVRDPEEKLTCVTARDLRSGYCGIKTLNLLPNILAAQSAADAGADEAILLRGKTVTECSRSNLSILHGGTLITHPADGGIYPGTGRAKLLNACKTCGIPVSERKFSKKELFDADEVLITSASLPCNSVTRIDGRGVGGKDPDTVARLRETVSRNLFGDAPQ